MCTSQCLTDTRIESEGSISLSDRLFRGTIATLELFSMYLGLRLGLYATLRDGRARDVATFAREAGIAPRYASEWLQQQAVAGLLEVLEVEGDRDGSTHLFSLTEAGAKVLCDAEDPEHVAPFAQMLVGIAQALPLVEAAYRSGHGVPYAAYGPSFRAGQGAINRPAFARDLCGEWLAALPDIVERLRSPHASLVVDLGCGLGHATRALAEAFPNAQVIGCDVDTSSIDDARRLAETHCSRARFIHGELESVVRPGSVDLVLILETLHDLSHPRETLEAARRSLTEGGALFVADERVADRFVAPGDEVERMMFGWSVTHCLPSSLATPGSAALGTALRPDRVRTLAREAGFARCEVLAIENDLFRFYRMS